MRCIALSVRFVESGRGGRAVRRHGRLVTAMGALAEAVDAR